MSIQINKSTAILCPLSGKYLIEASAGTGKTFTLTGILLRLLIEKRISPEHVIATTFTRAAASEMQERLYARITDFEMVCDWQQRQENTAQLLTKSYDEQYLFFDELVNEIHDDHQQIPLEIKRLLNDEVNRHLLAYVLINSTLDKTLYQLSALIANVDKMFIGTLDSLAQKWLNEFGSEIGLSGKSDIVSDAGLLSEEIIHDSLRKLHSHLFYNAKILYKFLFFDNSPPLKLSLFSDIGGALKDTKNSLNFLTATIDNPKDGSNNYVLSMENLFNDDWLLDTQNLFKKSIDLDFDDFHTNIVKEYGINGSGRLAKFIQGLPTLIETLRNNDNNLSVLSDAQKKLLELEEGDIKLPKFNKGFEHKAADWQKLPLENLILLTDSYKKINKIGDDFKEKLRYFLAMTLRHELNKKLDSNHQTTFSKQMADLAGALSGERGKLLAQHIRHLYPVALIDEVQDINGEQLALIERLYLNVGADKDIFRNGRGFLLCVGDPKQAIYRFRGGDILNYNNLKKQGFQGSFSLNKNFRSNQTLIHALNVWFEQENTNTFGDEIHYQHIEAHNDYHSLGWHEFLNEKQAQSTNVEAYLPNSPLCILHGNKEVDKLVSFIAMHINTILQTGKITEKNQMTRAIKPSDIAILSRNHKGLEVIKIALMEYGIDASTDKMGSIFATPACHALYELLWAMIDDGNDRLGAVLTGLYRLDLASANEVLADDVKRLALITHLKTAEQKWLTLGVGVALEWAFSDWQFANWQKNGLDYGDNLWQYLAQFDDGERFLTDVWQLFALFCEDVDFVGKTATSPTKFLTALNAKRIANSEDGQYARIALPSDSAISLMTIHGSKGLEFPIVYVLELDTAPHPASYDEGLYPYIDKKNHRRLSPKNTADNKQRNKEELINERRRLGYVALTRAKEQVFIVARDKNKASECLLSDWGFYAKECFQSYLPEEVVSVLSLHEMEKSLIKNPYIKNDEKKNAINYQDWQSVFEKTFFYGTYRTSFTGLTRLFDKLGNPTHDKVLLEQIDIPEYLILDSEYDDLIDDYHNYENDDKNKIRKDFVRGADAGIFLHKIFEMMQGNDFYAISKLVNDIAKSVKLSKEYQLAEQKTGDDSPIISVNPQNNSHVALVEWLIDVSNSQLVSGTSLAKIKPTHKRSELKFTISSQGLDLKKLTDMFEKYLPNNPIPDFIDNHRLFNYLTGEIDLLYCYQDKYYIVDYKSNYLADFYWEYDNNIMHTAMTKSGYWLQAVIYQLVLHRLLKLRIDNYHGNEHQFLGQVEYLFLRGIAPTQTHNVLDNNQRTGHLIFDIPIDMILALDALFS